MLVRVHCRGRWSLGIFRLGRFGCCRRGPSLDLGGAFSKITGIKIAILCRVLPLSSGAVAQRMSRAASPTTTRMEDMAYCRLSIFDVNMPLLYSEEEKALRRLQEEIIRSTADLSIFAWKYPPVFKETQTSNSLAFSGFLAEFPSVFH